MVAWYLLAALAAVWLIARLVLPSILAPRPATVEHRVAPGGNSDTLVVMVHGMTGRQSFEGAVQRVRAWLPHADMAIADYDCRPGTNADCYVVADVVEREIHRLVSTVGYRKLILVGHSAGGAILRKSFVWGHGHEEDRARFGARGKRDWVDRVARMVLLAGINRGYSIEPRPDNMPLGVYLGIWLALRMGRLFGVARLARQLYRGEPFIADTRVQWLRIARSEAVVSGEQPFPTVIQLLGSEDDIVSRDDSVDLAASRGTWFKTLAQTGHRDIGASLEDDRLPGHEERVRSIRLAILGELDALDPDKPQFPPEYRDVTRLVYVMHGIRDYGDWTEAVRRAIEARCAQAGIEARVVNHKYGYFPMLPFIIYADRQKNVRRFMDEYTENLARYPNAGTVDFVGHSNGTYILASVLANYAAPRVRRVFFAGSVVPKHYPWRKLVEAGRVQQVVNVVATADWVVAIFPKLFEQIADWCGRQPVKGWLDIGAAGFRGFLDAGSASGAVMDLKFAEGQHSTGVEVSVPAKLSAIVGFVVDGDTTGLTSYEAAKSQNPVLNVVSNVSYLVWALILSIATGLGWWIAATWGTIGLAVYLIVLILLLHSL